MKLGDLVRWYSVANDQSQSFDIDIGVVVELSRTGHNTLSALVLFDDGTIDWISTETLEVINDTAD